MNNKTELTDAAGHAGKIITVTAKGHSREIHLSPTALLLSGTAAVVAIGWTTVTSAFFVMSMVSPVDETAQASALQDAYQARIETLGAERDTSREALRQANTRFAKSHAQISALQSDLTSAIRDRQELRTSVDLMRGQLANALAARNAAVTEAEMLTAQLSETEAESQSGGTTIELADTLNVISDSLGSTVRERDTALDNLAALETEIASLELSMEISAERQERLIAGLEDAVEMSFKPLETMFERSGLNVDTLVSAITPTTTGHGGPLTPVLLSTRGFDDPLLSARFSDMMQGMDKMNSMRIAATKIPFTMPVHTAHRFTSGFGTRRDPKTGGYRSHNGIDLAGSTGSPIHATADGVVIHASRQSGFGNLVKIRHEFGFETLYAHLNKIHVKVGDRIARGDHIGDMGTTGRSTGVHLHYEVRIGGKPVNPLTYIKAARDVF